MQWHCQACGTENGPEAVFCTECGTRQAEPEAGSAAATRVHSSGGGRSTLVGSSTAVAPSFLDRSSDLALLQSLPRRVHISPAGWIALVGGWPELAICLVAIPLVAIGAMGLLPFLGTVGAGLLIGGLLLFLPLAMLYGAGDTSRTLRGYRLARRGWAAGGEITRKTKKAGRFGALFGVEYGYLDARGVRRHGVQEIAEEQWQVVAPHQPVTVLYDPADPTRSVVYDLLGVIAIDPASHLPSGQASERAGTTAGAGDAIELPGAAGADPGEPNAVPADGGLSPVPRPG